MLKFFRIPFATSGDRAAVPDPVDVNGSVTYTEGYGFDYERQETDPAVKYIERTKMNELFFDVTTALAELQSQGAPDFITSALNGGTAYSYAKNAIVRYGGAVYLSTANGNTSAPTDATKWAPLLQLASVLDSGAAGNGVDDDTAAINAASAAVVGPVVLPMGREYVYGGSVAFSNALTLYDKIPASDPLHDSVYVLRDVANGGTSANQQCGIKNISVLNTGVTHPEVGIFSILNDYAATSGQEHVALYAQATSLLHADSPLWAAVFEVRNTTPTGGGSDVDHALNGVEIDVVNDKTFSSVTKKLGIQLVAYGGGECTDGITITAAANTWANGTYNSGGWRTGVSIAANAVNAALGSGVAVESNHAWGLNITGVSSGAAIALAAGAATTFGITINDNYVVPLAIQPDKTIRLNGNGNIDGVKYDSANTAVTLVGAAIGVTGHTTYPGATAGGSQAVPASVGGYLGVYVNGALKKVPFFNI